MGSLVEDTYSIPNNEIRKFQVWNKISLIPFISAGVIITLLNILVIIKVLRQLIIKFNNRLFIFMIGCILSIIQISNLTFINSYYLTIPTRSKEYPIICAVFRYIYISSTHSVSTHLTLMTTETALAIFYPIWYKHNVEKRITRMIVLNVGIHVILFGFHTFGFSFESEDGCKYYIPENFNAPLSVAFLALPFCNNCIILIGFFATAKKN